MFSGMCSKGVALFVLIGSNLIIFCVGAVMFVSGVAAKANPVEFSSYISDLPNLVSVDADFGKLLVNSGTWLIFVGLLLLLFSFFGWFGGFYGITWMLLMYWLSFLIFICFEVGVVSYFAVSPEKAEEKSLNLLFKSFKKYSPEKIDNNGSLVLPNEAISLFWFYLQIDYDCCGVKSPSDYQQNNYWFRIYKMEGKKFIAQVPPSCCLRKNYKYLKDNKKLKFCMVTRSGDCHRIGCMQALKGYIERILLIVIVATVLKISNDVVSVVSAIYLWRLSLCEHKPI